MAEAKKRAELLLVDTDESFISKMQGILKKIYNIKSFTSTTLALRELQGKYRPQVIIATHNLANGEDGSIFLEKTIKSSPLSSRVIIVSGLKPNDIIKIINKCHAFMFIEKGWKDFEIFQAVLLSTDNFKNKVIKRKTNVENQKKFNELNELINQLNSSKTDLSTKISNISLEREELSKEIHEVNEKNENLKIRIEEVSKEREELSNKVTNTEKEISKLSIENDNLYNQIANIEVYPNQSITALTKFIKEFEHLYFTPHTYHVETIVRALGNEMNINPFELNNLVIASKLHNITVLVMPEEMQLEDPIDMDEIKRKAYFKLFNKSIKILQEIDLLKRPIEMIAQLHEHCDGTGLPNGLFEEEMTIESQILAIANIYHNKVYRIPKTSLATLRKTGQLIQSKDQSSEKHKETMKFFFKNPKWFSKSVVRAFKDLANTFEIESLVPPNNRLVLTYDEKSMAKLLDFIKNNKAESILKDDAVNFVERKLHPFNAKAGMITGQAIKTLNGIIAFDTDHKLDKEDVKKITQLAVSNLIEERISFKVPSVYTD